MTSTRTLHARRLLTVSAVATLLSLPGAPGIAAPDHGNGNASGKQTICHATHSDTNPYVVHTPNKNGSVSGHAKHVGPIWNATLKAQHIAWGDIIPPFDYQSHGVVAHFPGLNWTEEGQAWFDNGCQAPPPPPPAPDVAVAKTGTATAAPGDQITWTLTATNTGTVPASDVTMTDTLPTGTTLVSASGTGWTVSGTTTLTMTYDTDLGVGASASVTVVAALDAAFAGTTVDNTVVVTPEDETPTDNTATWTTDVTQGGGGGGGGGFTGGGGGTLTGGGGGVTLPRTGTDTWLLLVVGIALILSGSGFVLLPQGLGRRS